MKEHIIKCNECKVSWVDCFVKKLACTARNRQIENMLYCPKGFWGIIPNNLTRKVIKVLSSTTDNLDILKTTIDSILKNKGLTREEIEIEIEKENEENEENDKFNIKLIKKENISNGE